jgi:hypothetical protein
MRTDLRSDGVWMMLWPLTMAIGIWGVGLIYHGIANRQGTLWVGIALLCGGGFLSGRWIAQARHLYRFAKRRAKAQAQGADSGRA